VKGPPIEPLPADIASLLEREKNAYPEDIAAKRAVFARVEMALVLGGATLGTAGATASGSAPPAGGGHAAVGTGAASAAAAKGAITGKIVAIGLAGFVAGGVAGGAAVKETMHAPSSRPAAAVATTASSAAPRVPERVPSLPAAAASATPAAVAPPAETPSATPAGNPSASTGRPASSVGDLTRERELLDAARAALDRGRPNDAVAAAREHAQKWPRGYLAEEREVVLIQGLVAAGHQQEAELRAAQFHRSFPKSILGPAVDAAVHPPIP
jgi:hypothetical protein